MSVFTSTSLQLAGTPLTIEMLVVVAVIAAAIVLFVLQPVPIDTTAIAIMVALIVLEPWTGVTPGDGVSGFSNPATITVLAMFILSEGVRRTGAIQLLTRAVGAYTGGSESRQLLATLGLGGPPAGFVNNTPVVAILIPAVTDLAQRAGTSPSKLLMPLSFASMMGGTLTLIGTSSNLLASDVWARQGGPGAEPFGLFEFTQLGVVVLAVGTLYLFTVGRYLVPQRISASDDPADGFGMADYLTDVVVREDSPLVGTTIRDLRRDEAFDVDVFQIVRRGRTVDTHLPAERIRVGDVLAVRADEETLQRVLAEGSLDLLPELVGNDEVELSEPVQRALDALESERVEEPPEDGGSGDVADDASSVDHTLTEVVLLPGTWLSGRTVRIADFERRHDVTALALRRGSDIVRQRMRSVRLQGGDTLLVQASDAGLERLRTDRSIIVSGDQAWESFDRAKIPIALGVVAGVVGLAAFDVLPIMVSALAGVVAMIVTGCLRPADAYEAVNWDVIFLLAGVIPLGIALERSGTADVLGDLIVSTAGTFPAIALLGVFYLFTALLTNLLSNNASIVLMIPIAIDAATQLGANSFSFVLAVTFAASTAFVTPVGYQTNLMVYGPGGYRFTDFARVGLPLQLLLTVVTTIGIAFFWGV